MNLLLILAGCVWVFSCSPADRQFISKLPDKQCYSCIFKKKKKKDFLSHSLTINQKQEVFIRMNRRFRFVEGNKKAFRLWRLAKRTTADIEMNRFVFFRNVHMKRQISERNSVRSSMGHLSWATPTTGCHLIKVNPSNLHVLVFLSAIFHGGNLQEIEPSHRGGKRFLTQKHKWLRASNAGAALGTQVRIMGVVVFQVVSPILLTAYVRIVRPDPMQAINQLSSQIYTLWDCLLASFPLTINVDSSSLSVCLVLMPRVPGNGGKNKTVSD